MNVDHLIRIMLHEGRGQHAHIFGQHHVIRLILIDLGRHFSVVLFTRQAFVAHQMERNIETFHERLQRVVVADHGGDFNVEAAIGAFHQQIARAVGLFGDQHHDAAASGAVQLAQQPSGSALSRSASSVLSLKMPSSSVRMKKRPVR